MKYFFVTLFCVLIFDLNAQVNLVRNGDFEQNRGIASLEEQIKLYNTGLSYQLPHWQNDVIGFPYVCYSDYTQKRTEDEFKGNFCRFPEKYKPQSGKTMLELQVSYNCARTADDPFIGCADYVAQKLESPLVIGKVYEVSFWVNYTDIYEEQDPNGDRHVGFLLSNQRLKPEPTLAIIQNTSFLSLAIPYNQWSKLTWYLRPTCELNYLTIGTFKDNNWPKYTNPHHWYSIYFIDNVSIIEIPESKVIVENITPTYYCKDLPKEPDNEDVVLNSTPTLYFDVNSSYLTDSERAKLDSFALLAIKYPNIIFEVLGHTDSKGENNMELSINRTSAVIDYLTSVHKLPNYRFINLSFGEEIPLSSNNTIKGRSLNRRANIQQSKLSKANATYRKVIESASNKDWKNAFKLLNGYLKNVKDQEKILLLFDPHIEDLRSMPLFHEIRKDIFRYYEKFVNPKLAFLLDSLYVEDQKYRTLSPFIQSMKGIIYGTDTTKWDFPKISDQKWAEHDSMNLACLLNILQKYNTPLESEVGKRSAKAIPLIIIHSQDTSLIKKYLPRFKEICTMGEGEFGYYAMMYDKLQVLTGNNQKYGTQFYKNAETDFKFIRYPSGSLEDVNIERNKIGLPPLLTLDTPENLND